MLSLYTQTRAVSGVEAGESLEQLLLVLLAGVSTAVVVKSGAAFAGLDVRAQVDILAKILQGEGRQNGWPVMDFTQPDVTV